MAMAHYQATNFHSMSSVLEDSELLKKNLFRSSVGFRKKADLNARDFYCANQMWHRSHMIHCCSESPEPCPQKIPLRS